MYPREGARGLMIAMEPLRFQFLFFPLSPCPGVMIDQMKICTYICDRTITNVV